MVIYAALVFLLLLLCLIGNGPVIQVVILKKFVELPNELKKMLKIELMRLNVE
ncbi:hypothetical protein [Aneurinibacillus sp. UBA3580]|uniref:hypothetical protein n=1 Tax=Aneurinibacillus sp. UBA3580 TaxID=1946041 RepID=UPI00257BA193|nr:hypothetical protein [Aneurinibacillus sp. UBA3580]